MSRASVEIARMLEPKVDLSRARPKRAAPFHRLLPFEPTPAEKIRNVIRRAAEMVGLGDVETRLVLKAYDESYDPGAQGAKARFLPQVSPEVFSAIAQALQRESQTPGATVSRSELNQWVGFETRWGPPEKLRRDVEKLQLLQAGLAIQMQIASTLAQRASDEDFLRALDRASNQTQRPELIAVVPTVLQALKGSEPLVETFGRCP